MKKSEKNIHLACYIYIKPLLTVSKKYFEENQHDRGRRRQLLQREAMPHKFHSMGRGDLVDTLERN